MKKNFKVWGMLILIIAVFAIVAKQDVVQAATSTSYFAGGEGTEEDPYQISTTKHLDNVRIYPSAHYKLINDLVFTSEDYNYGQFYNSGCYWNPISNFTGTFDGNNYSIDGLKINRTWAGETENGVSSATAYYGLFAEVNGSIKNLTLSNVDIKITVKKYVLNSSSSFSSTVYVGAVVGYLKGAIENCTVSGNVKVTGQTDLVSAYVGGVIGSTYSTSDKTLAIYNCYNTASVEAICNLSGSSFTVGGIVAGGWSNWCTDEIINCVNKGTIYSKAYDSVTLGGIIGSPSTACIKNCYNFGEVEGYNANNTAIVGGIVGRASSAVVQKCGNFGNVIAQGISAVASGILVYNDQGGSLQYCFNVGNICATDIGKYDYRGEARASGITCNTYGPIEQCFNSGVVDAYGEESVDAAGIAVVSFKSISNSYNTGDINSQRGARYVGTAGIVVNCSAAVSHCYNVGAINGDELGGIAHSVYTSSSSSSPSVTDCYYLDNVSKGIYEILDTVTTNTVQCNSANMKKQSTYKNFDFTNVWVLEDGEYQYPKLINNYFEDAGIEDVCSKIGHALVRYSAKKATCTENGWEAYDACYFCDYSTYKEIGASGHEIDNEWKVIQAPTCTDSGYEAKSCTRCGYTGFEKVLCDVATYPESPHNYGNSKTYEYSFSYPGALRLHLVFSSNTETEKTYDKIYIYDTNGNLIGTYTGTELKSKELEIEGNGFKIMLTSDGSVNKYGFRFEAIYAEVVDGINSREIEALGHEYVEHEAKAACEEIGWNAYVTCTRCDYSTYEEIAPMGHEYVNHEAKEPTCTEVGWNAYEECTRCGYTTYEEIAALGHDEIEHESKTVTCTEIGWNEYVTCTRCDYTTYEEVAALGHDIQSHEMKAPTCTENGWNAYEHCTRCNYSTYEAKAALGHDFEGKDCVRCDESKTPSYSWDVSVNNDGSVMAYAYAIDESNLLLEIVGQGAMKDYTTYSNTPWYQVRNRIQELVIGSQITYVGAYSFGKLSNLASVSISESVSSIGARAFYECESLRHVSIPRNVQSIGDSVFYYCSNLIITFESDSLPSKLGSLWNYGVGYYINPKEVICFEDATYVITRDDQCFMAKYSGDGEQYRVHEIVNGVQVQHIGRHAFFDKMELKAVWIPDGFKSIEAEAFYECNLLILFESDRLPTQLGLSWKDINPYYLNPKEVIFDGECIYVITQTDECYLAKYRGDANNFEMIETIKGNKVSHIGEYAFASSYKLLTFNVPKYIKSIGKNAFSYCNKLVITFEDDKLPTDCEKDWNGGCPYYFNPQDIVIVGDYIYVIMQNGEAYLAKYNGYEQRVVIPKEIEGYPVKHIGDYCFYSKYATYYIKILANIETIGKEAFRSCYYLKDIVIPGSVKKIGDGAFAYCSALKCVYIQSESIAQLLQSLSACGELCKNAQTIAIARNITFDNTYLKTNYSYVDEVMMDGESYIIYSKCQHVWSESIITEMVPCQQDGLISLTCTKCGVQNETVIPCHENEVLDAEVKPTFTTTGLTEGKHCSACGTVLVEQEIIPAIEPQEEHLVWVRKVLAGMQDDDSAMADVNGDSVIDIRDVVCLKKKLAEKTNVESYPQLTSMSGTWVLKFDINNEVIVEQTYSFEDGVLCGEWQYLLKTSWMEVEGIEAPCTEGDDEHCVIWNDKHYCRYGGGMVIESGKVSEEGDVVVITDDDNHEMVLKRISATSMEVVSVDGNFAYASVDCPPAPVHSIMAYNESSY